MVKFQAEQGLLSSSTVLRGTVTLMKMSRVQVHHQVVSLQSTILRSLTVSTIIAVLRRLKENLQRNSLKCRSVRMCFVPRVEIRKRTALIKTVINAPCAMYDTSNKYQCKIKCCSSSNPCQDHQSLKN